MNSAPSVLHIYKDYCPPVFGGVERTIAALAQGAKRAGYRVRVLVANPSGGPDGREEIEGIEVIRVRQWGRFLAAPVCPSFPLWLRRLGNDADLLHFHFPNPTGEIAYLLSGLRKKALVSYYSDIVRQRISSRLYRPLLNLFFRRVNMVCPITGNYVQGSPFLRSLGRACRPIPLGIDVLPYAESPPEEELRRLREQYGGAPILFVGMFRHYKGIHELLQAVRKVPNTPLVMIGEGLLYERARKWVGEMGLEGRVFLLGRRSDEEVRLHLHACLFLVLPSTNRAEAFGLALLEAMACGKPVISTELGTGTSVVNLNGRTGLVVPPGDVEALRLALNTLVTDGGLRERMGEEARRRVAEEFCQGKMIRQYLRVYEELLSARQGAS